MASGEEKDKGKDHYDPNDPDKKNDKNEEAISPTNATGKKSKNEDNPFSFKKFLQASEGQNGSKGGCIKLVNHDLAKDLPDFVQGHSSHTESNRSQNNLPDFTFCTSSKNTPNDINATTCQPPLIPPLPRQPSDDTNNLSLPDFLSGSVGIPLLKNNSIDENENNLQLQNTLLWQKIEQLNAAFLAEKQRNEALSAQLLERTTELTPSTSKCSQDVLNDLNSQESQPTPVNEEEEGGRRRCGRCGQMAEHLRNASEQLNTIVQAANHFSRVLTDGSEHLNSICRLVASESSASTQQTTVQNDN